MGEGCEGPKAMQEAGPVWRRGSARERLDPILGTAGYLCDPSKHRDAPHSAAAFGELVGSQISGAGRLKKSS